MAKMNYNWIAVLLLGAIFVFAVVAPNRDAFATSFSNFGQLRASPDLIPTHIGVARNLAGSLYTDTITVTVENKGGSNAGPFTVEVNDALYGKTLATFRVDGLRKGDVHNFIAYYKNAPKQYNIQVFADKNNEVAELDENNNAPMRVAP